MREVLYLGTHQGAVDHLDQGARFITATAEQLGLELTRAAADDPFYDKGGSRAKLMKLDPVKHEFSPPTAPPSPPSTATATSSASASTSGPASTAPPTARASPSAWSAGCTR